MDTTLPSNCSVSPSKESNEYRPSSGSRTRYTARTLSWVHRRYASGPTEKTSHADSTGSMEVSALIPSNFQALREWTLGMEEEGNPCRWNENRSGPSPKLRPPPNHKPVPISEKFLLSSPPSLLFRIVLPRLPLLLPASQPQAEARSSGNPTGKYDPPLNSSPALQAQEAWIRSCALGWYG